MELFGVRLAFNTDTLAELFLAAAKTTVVEMEEIERAEASALAAAPEATDDAVGEGRRELGRELVKAPELSIRPIDGRAARPADVNPAPAWDAP